MATEDILAEINALTSEFSSERELTGTETAKGYLRSLLGGTTLNFADEAEAAIASALTDKTYRQELNQIRGEQALFKDKTEYLDNAVEIGGSFINPFAILGRIGQAVGLVNKAKEASTVAALAPEATSLFEKAIGVAKPLTEAKLVPTSILPKGKATADFLLNNAVSQGALAGVGAAESTGDILPAAAGGGLAGLAGKYVGEGLGNLMQTGAREADRLKLSAFNVRGADVGKALKKLDAVGGTIDDAGKLPLLRTLDKEAKSGLISVDNDILTNASNLALKQKKALSPVIGGIIEAADQILPKRTSFLTKNTDEFLEGLVGTAREDAKALAQREIKAIREQMVNGGSLEDLQNAKVGLGRIWDDNPYKPNLFKALRQDLREEIENRVALAELVAPGKLPKGSKRLLHYTNEEWGKLEELKDVFKTQARQDLQSDIIEDSFGSIRTSGGAGTLLNLSGSSGSPIPAIAGAALTAGRTNAAKYKLGQILEEFQTPLAAGGKIVTELGRPRVGAQAYLGPRDSPEAKKSRRVEARKDSAKGQEVKQSLDDILNELRDLTDVPSGAKKTPISIVAEIESDPVDAAIFEVESSSGKNLRNPESTAKGAFQLIDSTAKSLGVNKVMDLAENFQGYKKLKADHIEKFGDDPDLIYAAHVLGATRLKRLQKNQLTDEDKPIINKFIKVELPRFQLALKAKLAKQAEGAQLAQLLSEAGIG